MFDDLENLFNSVDRDIQCCKALRELVMQIAMIRPFIMKSKELAGDDESLKALMMKSIMGSVREDGIELSVEEAEEMLEAFECILRALEIFDQNYENWSEKGKFIINNKKNKPLDDPDLPDFLK